MSSKFNNYSQQFILHMMGFLPRSHPIMDAWTTSIREAQMGLQQRYGFPKTGLPFEPPGSTPQGTTWARTSEGYALVPSPMDEQYVISLVNSFREHQALVNEEELAGHTFASQNVPQAMPGVVKRTTVTEELVPAVGVGEQINSVSNLAVGEQINAVPVVVEPAVPVVQGEQEAKLLDQQQAMLATANNPQDLQVVGDKVVLPTGPMQVVGPVTTADPIIQQAQQPQVLSNAVIEQPVKVESSEVFEHTLVAAPPQDITLVPQPPSVDELPISHPQADNVVPQDTVLTTPQEGRSAPLPNTNKPTVLSAPVVHSGPATKPAVTVAQPVRTQVMPPKPVIAKPSGPTKPNKRR